MLASSDDLLLKIRSSIRIKFVSQVTDVRGNTRYTIDTIDNAMFLHEINAILYDDGCCRNKKKEIYELQIDVDVGVAYNGKNCLWQIFI